MLAHCHQLSGLARKSQLCILTLQSLGARVGLVARKKQRHWNAEVLCHAQLDSQRHARKSMDRGPSFSGQNQRESLVHEIAGSKWENLRKQKPKMPLHYVFTQHGPSVRQETVHPGATASFAPREMGSHSEFFL